MQRTAKIRIMSSVKMMAHAARAASVYHSAATSIVLSALLIPPRLVLEALSVLPVRMIHQAKKVVQSANAIQDLEVVSLKQFSEAMKQNQKFPIKV